MNNYNQTDQYLHWLSQMLAKINKSFVTSKSDDSHTNLYFDELSNRILGRWIITPNDKMMLSLNLNTFTYEWLNTSQRVIGSISTLNKSIVEVENELEHSLVALGLNSSSFIKTLHYEIPTYDFINQKIKNISKEALHEWTTLRTLANEKAHAILSSLQTDGEVRIWPHHFDTGIYIIPNRKMGIGFGLAMQDSMVGAPYFYMAGYAQSGNINYDELPTLSFGEWKISEHWKGAVLSVENIKSHEIDQFIHEAVDYFLSK